MTCKDCVHYEACKEMFEAYKNDSEDWEKDFDDCDFGNCNHFKNKADFVEVKRAKWTYETRYYSCSVCGGKRFNLLLGTDAEYCPYCGAKMIFEKEGADNG